jgi:hypothetical protein
MVSLHYFAEGNAREPGEVVILELADETVVFEEFFTARLRMPPQPVLTDILHKFCVQLHQLTPNAIAQLSKCFWVVLSFGGMPTSDGFTKLYGLHYQPKKVDGDEGAMYRQFGCVNFFHVKRYKGSRAKLALVVKNKWAARWMKAWFYYKVPAYICPQGGECARFTHTLVRTRLLDRPLPIDCPDDDSGDTAFVKPVSSIRGRDTVEEYLACGMHLLSTSVSFRGITDGVTLVSRIILPLPKFRAVHKDDEDDIQFSVRVELEAESIVGGHSRPEHDACMTSVLHVCQTCEGTREEKS